MRICLPPQGGVTAIYNKANGLLCGREIENLIWSERNANLIYTRVAFTAQLQWETNKRIKFQLTCSNESSFIAFMTPHPSRELWFSPSVTISIIFIVCCLQNNVIFHLLLLDLLVPIPFVLLCAFQPTKVKPRITYICSTDNVFCISSI